MTAPEPPEGEGFDLQAVYAENGVEPFRFRWADQWWELPHLLMLDFEVQARVEEFDPTTTTKDDINIFFVDVMGQEQADRWRQVTRPAPMLMAMLRQWVKHSGGTPGESAASDGSSKSTGRPSKRTSTGGTGSASRTRSTAKKATPAKAVTAPVSS